MAPQIAHRPALALLEQNQPLPLVAEFALFVAVSTTKWTMRRRTRLALKQLEPHQLHDIGLTRQEALDEATRAFWRN